MEKSWLIRTVEKKILGPASREKVLELLQKGSFRDNDEISCGNGFWFYIREKEYVERFLLSGAKQGFNPISEANTVLAKTDALGNVHSKGLQEVNDKVDQISKKAQGSFVVKFPESDDLEYPNPDDVSIKSQTEGTVVMNISEAMAKSQESEPAQSVGGSTKLEKNKVSKPDDSGVYFPDEEDLEYPDQMLDDRNLKPENLIEVGLEQARTVKAPSFDKLEEYKLKKKTRAQNKPKEADSRGSNFLIYTFLLGVGLLVVAIFYYLKYNNFELSYLSPLSTAQAQSKDLSLSKKKL